MNNHKIEPADKTSIVTHTRIGDKNLNIYSGKWHIPAADLPEFYKLYKDFVFVKKNKEYLTEKQLSTGGPMAVDLDFRYSGDVTSRQHNSSHVEDIVCSYCEEIKKHFSFDNNTKFYIWIFEKPNVNQLADNSLTKDGIHLIFGLSVPYSIQLQIRKSLIEHEPDLFKNLPLINTMESVLDEGISKGSTNWQLFGSCKPANQAYEMVSKYEIGFDEADSEITMGKVDFNMLDDFDKISVQCQAPAFKLNKTRSISPTSVAIDADYIGNPTNIQPLTKIQELLQLIKIDTKDRATWLRICSCLKSNGLTNMDWLQFCKKNKLNMDTEKDELFDKIKTDYCLQVYYLQSLAKISNPLEYKKWLEKWNVYYIDVDDLSDPYKSATTISKTLKHSLILCKEQWYMLTDNNLWKQQKEPSFYIIDELRKYIDNSNKKIVLQISQTEGVTKEKLIEQSKSYLKAYKSISSSGFLNVLTKYLKTLLTDDMFADKLDANVGKLAFKNGIMNLETKIFTNGILSSDFITQTIPYDYAEADETKKVFLTSVLKKILNNNEEHLQYFLSIIGFCFIGSPQLEKSIYFCVDKTDKACGDNGKTFYFDILTSLMPNYVYKSKGSFIEEGNTKIHKQLAMMKGKRLVWLDEFGKKQCNAELMKEIGDGLGIENEIMFGTSETVNILFKLFNLTNNLPAINPKDTAVYNRYKQISYGSHFDRTGSRTNDEPDKLLFMADTGLGDQIKKEYYLEVFELVINYAHKYYTSKLPKIPSQFIKDTKETQNNNDSFGLWFSENCEVSANDRVPLKSLVTSSGINEKLVKDAMVRLGFKYDRELSKMGKDENNKPFKGGYVGCKMLDIVEEEDN